MTGTSASIMRWFTRSWHEGELSDEDHERAVADYQAHLAALSDDTSVGAAELIGLNLHDAQVQDWALRDGVFSWTVLIGDLQRGYEFAEMTYSDAELIGTTADDLRSSQLDQRAFELVSDELDDAPGARYEHRFFFWKGPEFGVRFSRARVQRSPAPSDARR